MSVLATDEGVSVLLAAFAYADASTLGANRTSIAVESVVFFALIVFLASVCTAFGQESSG